jgi:5-(carboxyamino)imidazole ribonucleotide mutase
MTDQSRVGIIMGSDSDLGVMLDAARVLKQLGIGWEIKALSAHRTPHRVQDWVESLEGRGIQVVVAGAGGAAHLPGVIAALTPLPVIGVPVKSAALDGLDSLLSIVQMPPGIPVATVGVNAARNAGILAAQIIGSGDAEVRERVRAFKADLAKSVEGRNARLMDRVEAEL